MCINYSISICYAQNITCVIACSYIEYKLSDTCSLAITMLSVLHDNQKFMLVLLLYIVSY